MKYFLFILMLLPLQMMAQSKPEPLLSEELQAEIDRFMIDRLMTISKAKYQGKSVDELLNSEEAKGYTDMIFRFTPEGEIEYLMLQYSPTVFLSVYAGDQKDEKAIDHLAENNLKAFRKEPISNIGVRFILMQEGAR